MAWGYELSWREGCCWSWLWIMIERPQLIMHSKTFKRRVLRGCKNYLRQKLKWENPQSVYMIPLWPCKMNDQCKIEFSSASTSSLQNHKSLKGERESNKWVILRRLIGINLNIFACISWDNTNIVQGEKEDGAGGESQEWRWTKMRPADEM